MIKKILFLMIVVCILNAREEDVVPHVQEGNLALPTSQQPGPLFGFGQNIVDAHDKLLYASLDYIHLKTGHLTNVGPSFLYGISDDLSLYFSVPIILFDDNSEKPVHLAECIVQAEYAFYNKDTPTWANQATFVANITLPTRNVALINDLAVPSIFLGLTFSHLSINWYAFTSEGILGGFPQKNFKKDIQFFYQFGVGRNIIKPKGWIIMALIELLGNFTQQIFAIRSTKMQNNSKNNIIYIAPSIFASTEKLIIQAGIAFPISQTSSDNVFTRISSQVGINLAFKF